MYGTETSMNKSMLRIKIEKADYVYNQNLCKCIGKGYATD